VSEVSIPYPRDTSGREDWQLDYRYGGFYLFPPDGIIEDLDALRERNDPMSHRICQAHVSLSDPPVGSPRDLQRDAGPMLSTAAT
jgi:hypothetical protein